MSTNVKRWWMSMAPMTLPGTPASPAMAPTNVARPDARLPPGVDEEPHDAAGGGWLGRGFGHRCPLGGDHFRELGLYVAYAPPPWSGQVASP
jgi:hypothetical protein